MIDRMNINNGVINVGNVTGNVTNTDIINRNDWKSRMKFEIDQKDQHKYNNQNADVFNIADENATPVLIEIFEDGGYRRKEFIFKKRIAEKKFGMFELLMLLSIYTIIISALATLGPKIALIGFLATISLLIFVFRGNKEKSNG